MAKARVAKKPIPKKHRPTRDHLAIAAGKLNDAQRAIGLHRLALIGAVHEAASLKIPIEDLLNYARPVTEGLAHLENDVYQALGAILDADTQRKREARE